MAYRYFFMLAAALVLTAATCAGCTIYASDHEGDWDDDWDHRPPPKVRSDSGGAVGSTSAVPGSPSGFVAGGLMGRAVVVSLVEADELGARRMEGIIREMGDWVRLEQEDGSSVYIPRERIGHIELREAATTQPVTP